MSDPTALPNKPTSTWKNPRWASTPNELIPIFRSLQEFLARPNFRNGITIGDGTEDDKDSVNNTVNVAPSVNVLRQLDNTILPDLSIGSSKIIDEAITANKIALEAVTTVKIAPLAITATKISDGAIETPKLAANAVTANKISAGAVETDHLAANSVTTVKIAALTVNADKLTANSVTAEKLASISMEVAKYIRSSNYDPLVAGWAIDGNGNAEFNNVTIRGAVQSGGSITGSSFSTYVLSNTRISIGSTGNTIYFDTVDNSNPPVVLSSSVIDGTGSMLRMTSGTRSITLQSSSTGVVVVGSTTFSSTVEIAGSLTVTALDSYLDRVNFYELKARGAFPNTAGASSGLYLTVYSSAGTAYKVALLDNA